MLEITREMQSYIDGTLAEYKPAELETMPPVLRDRTILHLYPTHDTGDDGFVDGLFFDVKVYNSRQVWTIEGRDQVELNVAAPRVRIFKDGSTMLIIDRPVSIRAYQSMEVNEVVL